MIEPEDALETLSPEEHALIDTLTQWIRRSNPDPTRQLLVLSGVIVSWLANAHPSAVEALQTSQQLNQLIVKALKIASRRETH